MSTSDAQVARAARQAHVLAFHAACRKGDVERLCVLLSSDLSPVFEHPRALVNACDNDGKTALMVACESGHLEVVQLLIQRGADANYVRDYSINTPLFIACENAHIDIARLLLTNGADVDKGGCFSGTPLCVVSANGDTEIVRLLLEHSAATDRSDSEGDTPLISACSKGYIEIARLLLEHGADVEHPRHDCSPLHIASGLGQVDAVHLLIGFSADVNKRADMWGTPFFAACRSGHVEVARVLFQHGADVAVTSFGETPLDAASMIGALDVIRFLLLECGVDVDATSTNGSTALHTACRVGRLKVARLLLKHHADVNKPRDDGSTPLHAAVRGRNLEIVRELLLRGAAVDVANNSGVTPLAAASARQHVGVVQVLRRAGASDLPLRENDSASEVAAAADLDDDEL